MKTEFCDLFRFSGGHYDRLIAWVLLLIFGCAICPSLHADGREVVAFDAGWKFALQPKGSGFEQAGLTDSDWTMVDLPHTWNAFDGQDGGTYVRGDGWYRKRFAADAAWQGRRVFVQFDAISRIADVYLNGRLLGKHAGGYGRFRFDLTDALVPGENVLAVRANNEVNNILPLAGDFTMAGGIYRHVSLLIVNPLHLALLDFGSLGVYVTTEKLDLLQATVVVKTLLENSPAQPTDALVRVEIVDASGAVAANTVSPVSVSTVCTHECQLVVKSPRLWQGRKDPYLYHIKVSVVSEGQVIDSIEQPLGLRTVRVDPELGLFLNGERHDVHGVNYHQDMLDKGGAVSADDRRRDFDLMMELGCTSVRFCHYQHDSQAYELCDQRGLLAWAEFNFHFDVPSAENLPACLENAKVQLRELIRQNYNHPAIFCWSVGDETTEEELARAGPMLRELHELAKAEDPGRFTTYASHHLDDDPRNFLTDLVGLNPYYGWYYGKPADLGVRLDGFHRKYPLTALSVSEYGAGASIYQHEQNPPYRSRTQAKGPWHPEEWQNEIHEASWIALAPRKYLWGIYVWTMFDFASDRRKEGDHLGRNDKGLVTYDRLTRKDSFYWYKANWTSEPFVYLTSRRDVIRFESRTDVKVYSNCETVELFIDGISQGTKASPDRLFIWKSLALAEGPNRISAEARRGPTRVTDACEWIYVPGKPYRPADDAVGAVP